MEPQIRYCTTADGVSIAYWTMGDGPVIVDAGHPPTHIQAEWRLAPIRAWYERFTRRHTLVRFDTRGTGLSERNIDHYDLETIVLDLSAVVDDLKLADFTLMGGLNSGAAAIAYAARSPDRVSRLMLWCAYSRGSEFFGDSSTKALRDMIDQDWNMFLETSVRYRFRWTADEHGRDYVAVWRAAIEPRVQALLMDSLAPLDVTPLLADVKAPTLVMHREDRGADVARRIASGIPQASVALFPGGSAAPYLDDADQIWSVIAEFLGDDSRAAVASVDSLRTILFTDVVSNTALLQRLGDDAWRTLLREHERVTREQLAAHGGAEIKTMGDGFMASFGSATKALECAIAIQRAFTGDQLQVRIGLNAGEPIAEDDDLFGTAVTMAARIMSQAGGGEIFVSDVVRQLVAGKTFLFTDRGQAVLRGFDEPVRLYQVRIED